MRSEYESSEKLQDELEQLVMGSVAQDILLRADWPVLAVKAGAVGHD